jgi:transcriptional regulator with XRE-family HTH domain
VPENFGQRVRRLREAKQLGLRETAKKLDISAAYLSRIETNEERTPPAEDVIQMLADVLSDDFDELMRLAGRIPSDVKEYITTEGMPQFLRTAKDRNLTAKQLEEMLKRRK